MTIASAAKKGGKRAKKIVQVEEPAQEPVEIQNEIQESIEIQVQEKTEHEHEHEPDSQLQTEEKEKEHNIIDPINPCTLDLDDNQPLLKKRGRKPKGGKIIQNMVCNNQVNETKPNVILHLKCCLQDLQLVGDYNSNLTSSNIVSYQFDTDKTESIHEVLDKTIPIDIYDPSSFYLKCQQNDENEGSGLGLGLPQDSLNEISNSQKICDNKEIHRKLKILEQNLHSNNIIEKKSACFWCTYDFDNPPIFIPKHFIKNSYHVYGCFCTPECAVAYLMNENIDSSTKFERYQLLNHVYSKIYEYTKNIKPAPNPYYMLDKYYGNLSIQEYRALLKTDRLFLIVDKPLTRILPEFHEDNDDFILNNKIIPSNHYQIKKKGSSGSTNKVNILQEKFGF